MALERRAAPRDPTHARRDTATADALSRAEAAMRALADRFDGWMAEETERLEAARAGLHVAPDADAWAAAQTRAHDMKGLGGTYGFPLATRVCASLCRLLEDPARRASTPLALVDAHVEAVHAVVRHDLRDAAHPAGVALCERLESEAEAVLLRRAA